MAFQSKKDTKEVIISLRKTLSVTTDLNDLLKKIAGQINQFLGISEVEILLIDRKDKKFETHFPENKKESEMVAKLNKLS